MSQQKSTSTELAYATMMTSVVGQVGCLNILLIGISLGLGLLVDRLAGTDGIFAAIFILASVPVALWITMRISLKAIKRAQEQTERAQEEKEKLQKEAEESEAI